MHPGFSGGHCPAGGNFLYSFQKDTVPIAGAGQWVGSERGTCRARFQTLFSPTAAPMVLQRPQTSLLFSPLQGLKNEEPEDKKLEG